MREEANHLKAEVREKSSRFCNLVRTRTSDAELAMIEKDMQHTVYLQKILQEDITSFTKKIEAQDKTRLKEAEKVAQVESEAKSLGLMDPTLIDMFDRLSEIESRLKEDVNIISKSLTSKVKQREEKILRLKKLIENKNREIDIIDQEDDAIQRNIASLKKFETDRGLEYINMIAKKEKLKIAAITGKNLTPLSEAGYLDLEVKRGEAVSVEKGGSPAFVENDSMN